MKRERASKTQTYPGDRQRRALPNHKLEEVAPGGAERYSYSDFVRSLGDRIGDHAVKADRCEKQRNPRENAQ